MMNEQDEALLTLHCSADQSPMTCLVTEKFSGLYHCSTSSPLTACSQPRLDYRAGYNAEQAVRQRQQVASVNSTSEPHQNLQAVHAHLREVSGQNLIYRETVHRPCRIAYSLVLERTATLLRQQICRRLHCVLPEAEASCSDEGPRPCMQLTDRSYTA